MLLIVFLYDYIHVKNNHAPIFRKNIINNDNEIYYDSIFYDVYVCRNSYNKMYYNIVKNENYNSNFCSKWYNGASSVIDMKDKLNKKSLFMLIGVIITLIITIGLIFLIPRFHVKQFDASVILSVNSKYKDTSSVCYGNFIRCKKIN